MYTVYTMSCEGKGAFDVSQRAHDITYTTSIDGQPGKLSMTMEKNSGGNLEMSVGARVSFLDEEGRRVFSGRVFTLGTDRTEAYQVTAYDQMRYLKNHDYLNLDGEENRSLEDVFTKICAQAGLTYQIKAACSEPLNPHLFIDQSYYDMLRHCMDEANTRLEKLYFIRDRGGILIGDGSLLTDYKYEVDIDREACTEVYLMESIKTSSANGDKDKTSRVLAYAKADAEKETKWGRLRRIVNVKEQPSEEQLEEYARLVLDVYAKPSKSMRLEALGYPVYAGDGFRLILGKLGLNVSMYIMAATHTYGEVHTMSLDVCTGEFLPDGF